MTTCKATIVMVCDFCNNQFKLEVNRADLFAWNQGELIQDAFPYLSADERELLISSVCGDCFETIVSKGY